MSGIAELFRELDPLRPLGADEDALYVDWQRKLDPGVVDVRSRLTRGFLQNASPERPVTRLLTGHRGVGKTTELNRVAKELEEDDGRKRVFVSILFAEQWLDIEDVAPEDLVLQIVRQLVADLRGEGMVLGEQRLGGFFTSLRERASALRLEAAELGVDPLRFSFALKDFPTGRGEFRKLLSAQLPTVFDLVNRELLPEARRHLSTRGYDDVVLAVDDLDKIPQKVLTDSGLTNHENLFLDNAGTLRAISASLLLTVPIELAYSPVRGRLKDDYGASIVTVPLVPTRSREGERILEGEQALVEVIGRRVGQALGETSGDPSSIAERIFADPELLLRLVRLSGGHVRGLLVMATELLEWAGDLPIGQETVTRYVCSAARELVRGLRPSDKEILREVRRTGEMVDSARFFDLLRNRYVYAYEAGTEDDWYGLNPLLEETAL